MDILKEFIFIIISAIFIFLGISTISLNYDMVGSIGKTIGKVNLFLFSYFAYIYPFLMLALLYLIYKHVKAWNLRTFELVLGGVIVFFAILIIQAFAFDAKHGIIGNYIVLALRDFIGSIGIIVFILMLLTLAFVMIYEDNISDSLKQKFNDRKKIHSDENLDEFTQSLKETFSSEEIKEGDLANKEEPTSKSNDDKQEQTNTLSIKDINELKSSSNKDNKIITTKPSKLNKVEHLSEVAENKKLLDSLEKGCLEKPKDFKLPPLSFLKDPPKKQKNIDEGEIDKKIYDLLDKLRKFKIDGDVVRTYSGPVVTTFEFRPAAHIKVSKILTLEDDLAMALKAKTIRIQAPIPGKDVVGIEIPNKHIETIYLKEILQSDIFKNASSPLTIALGKDIVGQPFVTDLKKLPHLLIAGTTGSGKSVGINSMLLSLLYRNSPKTLRLIMIDPKMLEFSMYNDIPHLLTPVITESKQAITALSNLVSEMEKRYKMMSVAKTKNIENYNEKMVKEKGEILPYIVIIIDELADLMMTSGKDVEFYIGRLAQMARASGIHLIVATQRPSVDVVTGLIKANLPSRISYKVGQKVDSKVILDQMGADSLLGRGDMLFTPPGTSGLIRLHAPFASEEEIVKVVEFLKEQEPVVYDKDFLKDQDQSTQNPQDGTLGEVDELYEEAKNIVLSENKTSISYLQRRLKIGYNRSATIMEQLEKNGILSEINSKGQREIL